MKAEDARKLAFENGSRMNDLYEHIREAAKRGNSKCTVHTGMASKPEIELLIENGFKAGYENSPIDGAQYILIEW